MIERYGFIIYIDLASFVHFSLLQIKHGLKKLEKKCISNLERCLLSDGLTSDGLTSDGLT